MSQRSEVRSQKTGNKKQGLDFRLYLITDRKIVTHYPSLITAVEEALKAGVKAVQLREKDLPTRELLDMAYRMRDLTTKYNARLFINDRIDIAMCVNADGVHLGQSSIPAYAVRKAVDGSRFFIGVSTHNLEEALAAEREGADFITFGPIYPTYSKLKYGKPVGIESMKIVIENASIPIFGIGGIKPDNAKDVINAGAYGIAMISGILGENDIKKATENYLKILGETL
ncbi:thiamine-phosphate synthase [Dissulfurispira thermophila]|uniref:Thiamine-phosphate synthase n=2 Tax=root TaxID=1 RepID=A0A7G1H337_9BACT|nr:thiamine phosphate synthase [Dissulfurispira thermophila]BCB96137.1 thiamine-phosphate synthase [Dissulfurispira thermophila]